MVSKKTAVVIGYHGRKNLGDDVFLRTVIDWMHDELDVDKVFVAAPKGSIEGDINGVSVVAFEPTRYWVTSRLRWWYVFLRALRSDYMLFASGSIFTISPFFIELMCLKILRLLSHGKLKIVALGVSIGPFRCKRDQILCRYVVRCFDFLLLRDQVSATYLSSVNSTCYKVSYDLALASEYWGPRTQADEFCIGLCLNDVSRMFRRSANLVNDCPSFVEEIIAAIEEFVGKESRCHVTAFVVCADPHDGDQAVCREIVSRLKGKVSASIVTHDSSNPACVLDAIASCDCVISSRMHAGLFSMMFGIPVLQIAYAQKIRDLFSTCNLGYEHLYCPESLNRNDIASFLNACAQEVRYGGSR